MYSATAVRIARSTYQITLLRSSVPLSSHSRASSHCDLQTPDVPPSVVAVFEEEFNTTTFAGEALSAAEVLVEHPSSSSKAPEIIEAQKAAEAVAVSL